MPSPLKPAAMWAEKSGSNTLRIGKFIFSGLHLKRQIQKNFNVKTIKNTKYKIQKTKTGFFLTGEKFRILDRYPGDYHSLMRRILWSVRILFKLISLILLNPFRRILFKVGEGHLTACAVSRNDF